MKINILEEFYSYFCENCQRETPHFIEICLFKKNKADKIRKYKLACLICRRKMRGYILKDKLVWFKRGKR